MAVATLAIGLSGQVFGPQSPAVVPGLCHVCATRARMAALTIRGNKTMTFTKEMIAAAVATTLGAIVIIGLSTYTTTSSTTTTSYDQGRDAIPFRNVNGTMYVYASLGGVPHNMILDTGASMSSVTVPIAKVLLARHQAHVVPGFFGATIADGSTVLNQKISVNTVSIGRHRLHNVEMLVGEDGGGVLLGLSELNAIGSFTIDPSHGQIRFN
jgi:predicted aspartyl protease